MIKKANSPKKYKSLYIYNKDDIYIKMIYMCVCIYIYIYTQQQGIKIQEAKSNRTVKRNR